MLGRSGSVPPNAAPFRTIFAPSRVLVPRETVAGGPLPAIFGASSFDERRAARDCRVNSGTWRMDS
jgi:hypothetical protein